MKALLKWNQLRIGIYRIIEWRAEQVADWVNAKRANALRLKGIEANRFRAAMEGGYRVMAKQQGGMMRAEDTVEHCCICSYYDKEPFESYGKMCHCNECNAYNDGRKEQALISFKAGAREMVGLCKENQMPDDPSSYPYPGLVIISKAKFEDKLKDLGL